MFSCDYYPFYCIWRLQNVSAEQFPVTAHDILQAHSGKEKGCENSASNDALVGGGKPTLTRKAINPSENDSPDNEGVKQSRAILF